MTGSRTIDGRPGADGTVAPETTFVIEAAAISDRGLSEKRPVNEDSFLSDAERCVFAVADGVGGAQSGEVASQTAIETLDEAFRQHKAGEDVEDLMEIAFQRANVAIHQMSRDRHRLAMMATTIVALHLDGARATIGHVGDSRLYRLMPDGEFRRETADHSVVEEEVRAGRMSADEALHHPNRNVISRALGAEPNVEAELRVVEFNANTTFLLCSDGITRHVPDDELRELLVSESDLNRVCEELKTRCYARGAEDNLTAVIVRTGGCGTSRSLETTPLDAERTVAAERVHFAHATGDLPQAFAAFSAPPPQPDPVMPAPSVEKPNAENLKGAATTRLEVPISADILGINDDEPGAPVLPPNNPHVAAAEDISPADSATARLLSRHPRSNIPLAIGVAVLVLCAIGIGFYGAQYVRRTENAPPVTLAEQSGVGSSQPAPVPSVDEPASTQPPTYAERRAAVDEAPQIMMNKMWSEVGGAPLEQTDPEFLYLYGRAVFKMGNDREAQAAFRRTIQVMRQRPAAENRQPDVAKLEAVEDQLRTGDAPGLTRASEMLDAMIEQLSQPATSARARRRLHRRIVILGISVSVKSPFSTNFQPPHSGDHR